MLVDTRRRSAIRLGWTLLLGFFLGGLFTKISVTFLPDSAARTFLTTSVDMSFGPLSMDFVALAFTVGPLVISLNVLTLVGVFLVALIARSLI
jgi:hypothetical protein